MTIQQYGDYCISGTAAPNPSNIDYRETLGTVLESKPGSSVVEVARLRDTGVTFDVRGWLSGPA